MVASLWAPGETHRSGEKGERDLLQQWQSTNLAKKGHDLRGFSERHFSSRRGVSSLKSEVFVRADHITLQN